MLKGWPRDTSSQMEVINENGSTKICQHKSLYPLNVEDATGHSFCTYIDLSYSSALWKPLNNPWEINILLFGAFMIVGK